MAPIPWPTFFLLAAEYDASTLVSYLFLNKSPKPVPDVFPAISAELVLVSNHLHLEVHVYGHTGQTADLNPRSFDHSYFLYETPFQHYSAAAEPGLVVYLDHSSVLLSSTMPKVDLLQEPHYCPGMAPQMTGFTASKVIHTSLKSTGCFCIHICHGGHHGYPEYYFGCLVHIVITPVDTCLNSASLKPYTTSVAQHIKPILPLA